MEIEVYGLGYVGMVTALGLCKQGALVHGIEISSDKINSLSKSQLHIYEPGLDSWFSDSLANKLFTFSSSSNMNSQAHLADESERFVAIVCIGTPMEARGTVDLTQLRAVLKNIEGEVTSSCCKKVLLVLRSTVPPGTCEAEILPLLKRLKMASNSLEIDFIYYPEFLREGEAIVDFENPRLLALGCDADYESIETDWADLIDLLPGADRRQWVGIKTAEMMKYAQNSYNALRIVFSNELATVSSQYGVDIKELSELMRDNQSRESVGQYLLPGFSYGGPCLVKEVEALSWMGKKTGHEIPVISSISKSNLDHYERFLSVIEQKNPKKIIIFGVTFKPNTDDLRNSFVLRLIEDLLEGPSYKAPIDVSIVERAEVQDKVKLYFNSKPLVRVLGPRDLKDEKYDLVVFGPFKPDTNVIESMLSNSKESINLGFFDEIANFNF